MKAAREATAAAEARANKRQGLSPVAGVDGMEVEQARKGPAVAQMTDPESPIVTAAAVAAVAAVEARKEAAMAVMMAEAIAADPQAWIAARKADALAKRKERLAEERTKAAARNLTRSRSAAA
jgi:hypothetical protein